MKDTFYCHKCIYYIVNASTVCRDCHDQSNFLSMEVPMEEKTRIVTMVAEKGECKPAGEQALRFNSGKLPYDEIDPHFEEEIAKVILYGQKKYGRFNWMKGAPTSQFYGCIRRHLSALYKGEDIDQESGCTHIGHIATNLMMLHYNLRTKPENDDRVFAKKESV